MTVTNLADARPDYLRLKAVEDQIKVLQAERARLIEKLEPIGNAFFEYEGLHYTAKIVAPTTPIIPDLASLQKHNPDLFAMVTKTVLDKTKLRRLIDTNKLPAGIQVSWEPIKAHIQVRQVTQEGVELKDEATEAETA